MNRTPAINKIADYVYSILTTSIAAAATSTGTLQFQNDADFVIVGLKYFVDLAGAVQTDSTRVIPLVTVSLQNGANDKIMSNIPVQVDSLFGGREINFLSKPMRIPANSFINYTLYNFSAATTYANLRLDFIGYKVYQ